MNLKLYLKLFHRVISKDMKIDTLVCSGGGPSGIAYSGIFKALIEKGVINQELDGIEEIITTSIGILFSFCLLLKLNPTVANDICVKFDIGSMLNFDDITFDLESMELTVKGNKQVLRKKEFLLFLHKK